MRKSMLVLAVISLPATLAAQASGRAGGSATGTATVQSKQVDARTKADANARVQYTVPAEFSARGRARLEAMYTDAQEKELPAEPMERRVAEGQAKGASEAEILTAVGKVRGNLETSQRALVRAGREPRPEEVETGASAIERGFTEVQLETMAKRTPNERSLTVAFDVLSQLSARGMPVTNALAEVQAKLDARAPDAAIKSLTTIHGRIGGGK